MNLFFIRPKKKNPVSFEEILLDASNLPSFNVQRLEGRIELPLSEKSIMVVGAIFTIIAVVFFAQLIHLQVIQGAELAKKGEKNRTDQSLIIAERGTIYDRNGALIAWNERDESGEYDFPVRAYTDMHGLGQLIGYVSYPQKDRAGFYFRTEYIGRNGVEEAYNTKLAGTNGEQIVEANAHGDIISENVVNPQIPGQELYLSIDAELSQIMYDLIATTTETNGFRSGAGALMDVETGELIALTSFPSYDPEVLADGDDRALIKSYNEDTRYPYLNKVIGGVYTPGSIVKPFVAYAALAEGIIDPNKIIVSTGSITIPNPYDPSNPAVFRDWRQSLGPMTMRDAIAYSSNVYMMTIGGGYGDQKGLGITKLDQYYSLFGMGSTTGIQLSGEQVGLVPSPEWKKKTFNDDWRLGDTYLTSIGQYGFQVTPLQMLRAYAALANGGYLITPHVVRGEYGEKKNIGLNKKHLTVIQEGMRRTVIQDGGTARALERNDVAVAAKSGTAELGASKAHVNSWIAGFFPYEKPKYAFILFMEYGPRSNTVGAGSVMGKVMQWISEHRPEYFESTLPENES
jgi:penicillin-binding protein 2